MHQTHENAPSSSPSTQLNTKRWLLKTLRELVDHPEDIEVAVSNGQRITTFEASCAQVDMKRLIGKKGRTADSIRTLLNAMSGKQDRLYRFEILDPIG